MFLGGTLKAMVLRLMQGSFAANGRLPNALAQAARSNPSEVPLAILIESDARLLSPQFPTANFSGLVVNSPCAISPGAVSSDIWFPAKFDPGCGRRSGAGNTSGNSVDGFKAVRHVHEWRSGAC